MVSPQVFWRSNALRIVLRESQSPTVHIRSLLWVVSNMCSHHAAIFLGGNTWSPCSWVDDKWPYARDKVAGTAKDRYCRSCAFFIMKLLAAPSRVGQEAKFMEMGAHHVWCCFEISESWTWSNFKAHLSEAKQNHLRGVCFGDMGLHWDGLLWGFTKTNTSQIRAFYVPKICWLL